MIDKEDFLLKYWICHTEFISTLVVLDKTQKCVVDLRSKVRSQQQQIKYLCNKIKELEKWKKLRVY